MKKQVLLITIVFLILILTGIYFILSKSKLEKINSKTYFVAGYTNKIDVYDENYKKIGYLIRGNKIKTDGKVIKNEEKDYYKVNYDNKKYLIKREHIVDEEKKVVLEKEMFVRTPVTMYEKADDIKIISSIKKGEKLEIIGYDKIREGNVNQYKIKYNDLEGFVYSKYLLASQEESLKPYNENEKYEIHLKRTDRFGGGNASDADFYPVEKVKFEDNVMPDEVRSYYLTSEAIKNIDSYITLAKESNINAFVIDIKDSGRPGYKSPVMQEYSPTNYEKASMGLETYKSLVKKAKDAGLYLIGRVTVFKDYYYAIDHSEEAILDVRTNKQFSHNSSYWPTAFSRKVWEFNVALAREAVKEFGFNEIQFDYVRFPDRTISYEKSGVINLRNTYNESKVQAIQGFLMYATDEIHKLNAYVSADVFGESAYTYVTAYGQYWPAISNVVDVISAMPYPDHFNKYDFGFKEVVWTKPYDLLYLWGNEYAKVRQTEIPTPAVARTWIQAYNAIYEPKIEYDANKVYDQIKALHDSTLTGGYMTWNSGSNLEKYRSLKPAFTRGYDN